MTSYENERIKPATNKRTNKPTNQPASQQPTSKHILEPSRKPSTETQQRMLDANTACHTHRPNA